MLLGCKNTASGHSIILGRKAATKQAKLKAWRQCFHAKVLFGIGGAQFNIKAHTKLKTWELAHLRKFPPNRKDEALKEYNEQSAGKLNEVRHRKTCPHAIHIQLDRYFDARWRQGHVKDANGRNLAAEETRHRDDQWWQGVRANGYRGRKEGCRGDLLILFSTRSWHYMLSWMELAIC